MSKDYNEFRGMSFDDIKQELKDARLKRSTRIAELKMATTLRDNTSIEQRWAYYEEQAQELQKVINLLSRDIEDAQSELDRRNGIASNDQLANWRQTGGPKKGKKSKRPDTDVDIQTQGKKPYSKKEAKQAYEKAYKDKFEKKISRRPVR